MEGHVAVDMMAQNCAQMFVNNLDLCLEDTMRVSETTEMGFKNTETGKYSVVRVTMVLEPQVFDETIYSSIETSVTHGMKLLEKSNETTIPEHSDF